MDLSAEASKAIQKELARAKVKFPWWPVDPIHAAAIVNEEAGELTQAALQFTYEKGPYIAMLDEAVQVAAMAIRFIENIMEYREVKSKRTGALVNHMAELHKYWQANNEHSLERNEALRRIADVLDCMKQK